MRVAIHPIFSVQALDSVCAQGREVVQLTRDPMRGTHLTGRWRFVRAWVFGGLRRRA